MKRLVVVSVLAMGQMLGSDLAMAAACPGTVGDDPVVNVPAGKKARVMYVRPRDEASYLELCTRQGPGEWVQQWSSGTGHPNWVLMNNFTSESGAFQIKNFSTRLWGNISNQEPWTGMRRNAMPYGYTLNWYDSAGPQAPNTVVEICIYSNISECPNH